MRTKAARIACASSRLTSTSRQRRGYGRTCGLRVGTPRYRGLMAEIGFTLASEDWSPRELVQLAWRAEKTGFEYVLISDHIHPWSDNQGSSPFVWSVIGGIAQATER